MGPQSKKSAVQIKSAFTTAGNRAAFFILIFSFFILISSLFRQASAGEVPLVEELGYQLVELASEQPESLAQMAVHGESISEKETIEIAKELKNEKQQDVVVFATKQPIPPSATASYGEGVEYKVTVTNETIESVNFEVYEEVQPEQILSDWDLSQNVLDLVTGKVTVQLEMDQQWSKEKILGKAQALAQQILANNQSSGVAAVTLEIKTGEKTYLFDSEFANTLADYQLISL